MQPDPKFPQKLSPSSLSKSSSVSISFNNESIEDEPIEIIRNIKKNRMFSRYG